MLLLQRVKQRPWARHRTNTEVKQVGEGKQTRAFELKLLPEPISTQRQDHTSFAGVGGSAVTLSFFAATTPGRLVMQPVSQPSTPYSKGLAAAGVVTQTVFSPTDQCCFPCSQVGMKRAQQDFLKTAQKDPESNMARLEMYSCPPPPSTLSLVCLSAPDTLPIDPIHVLNSPFFEQEDPTMLFSSHISTTSTAVTEPGEGREAEVPFTSFSLTQYQHQGLSIC